MCTEAGVAAAVSTAMGEGLDEDGSAFAFLPLGFAAPVSNDMCAKSER